MDSNGKKCEKYLETKLNVVGELSKVNHVSFLVVFLQPHKTEGDAQLQRDLQTTSVHVQNTRQSPNGVAAMECFQAQNSSDIIPRKIECFSDSLK